MSESGPKDSGLFACCPSCPKKSSIILPERYSHAERHSGITGFPGQGTNSVSTNQTSENFLKSLFITKILIALTKNFCNHLVPGTVDVLFANSSVTHLHKLITA